MVLAVHEEGEFGCSGGQGDKVSLGQAEGKSPGGNWSRAAAHFRPELREGAGPHLGISHQRTCSGVNRWPRESEGRRGREGGVRGLRGSPEGDWSAVAPGLSGGEGVGSKAASCC